MSKTNYTIPAAPHCELTYIPMRDHLRRARGRTAARTAPEERFYTVAGTGDIRHHPRGGYAIPAPPTPHKTTPAPRRAAA